MSRNTEYEAGLLFTPTNCVILCNIDEVQRRLRSRFL